MEQRDASRFEELYREWTTEDLVKATTVDENEYEPGAIDMMRRELSRRGVSDSERGTYRDAVEKRLQQETKAISGIRGLLLVFVLVLCGNSLLTLIAGVVTVLDVSSLVGVTIGILAAGVGVYGFFTLWLILRKASAAPRHAQWWLDGTMAVSIASAVWGWAVIGIVDGRALGSLIAAGLWSAYLSESKRVRATFGAGPA